MSKRVLITGSSGYLGSRTVSMLHAAGGVDVFGIDIAYPRDAGAYAVFHAGSVTDAAAMERIFDAARPDVAVHLAFVVNPLHDRAREEHVDREGMRLFLRECERCAVGRVVVLSSVSAYGAFADNDEPLTESSCVRGIQSYAYSWMKAETDRMAQEYARDHASVETVILRPALFVGPHTHNAFFDVLTYPLVPQIREKGITRDPPLQFIHEDEMARCLVEAILKPGLSGVYNVAADGAVPYSELVRLCGKRTIPVPYSLLKAIARLLWALHISRAPAGQLEFIRYPWIMDNARMKRELFEPRIDSREAFRQFATKRI